MEKCYAEKKCTLHYTGKNYKCQAWFICLDCGYHEAHGKKYLKIPYSYRRLSGFKGLCYSCAMHCHRGHRTFFEACLLSFSVESGI